MKTIKQILAAMEACQKDMEALQGKCQSEQDQAKVAGYKAVLGDKMKEFDGLKAELEEAKTAADVQRTIDEAKRMAATVPGAELNPDDQPGDKGKSKVEVPSDKAKAERELTGHCCAFLAGKNISDVAHDALRPSARIMVGAKDVDANLTVMVPKGMAARILNPIFGGKVILSTDANAAANSNAHALLAPDFRPELLRQPVYNPVLYDLVKVIQAYNGKATWPKLDQTDGKHFGGVAFTWKSTEGADKGETEPKFSDFTVETHELSGWTEMSISALNRSSIALEALLTDLFQQAARYEFSKQILIGDGVNKPLGITQAPGLKMIARKAAGQINPKDLTALEFAVTKALRAGGIYILDDTAEQFLKDLSDGMDRPLFRQSLTDVMNPSNTRLNGYNYDGHEFGPALGTTGDILFGNPQQYCFAVEEDVAIARSDHAAFKQGRIVFRMISFVGGRPVYEDSFVGLGDPVAA
jgi:HK97 family phage major capsid protein